MKPKLASHQFSTSEAAVVRRMEHMRDWKELLCSVGEPPNGFEYLEMLRYPDRPEAVVMKGSVDDSSLSGWLSKELKLPCSLSENLCSTHPDSSKLKSPIGGQRLLFGVCNGDTESEQKIGTLPFSNRSWDLIKETLALPEDYIQYMLKKGSPSFKLSASARSGRSVTCFIFKFMLHRPGYYQLALTYDRETRITHGLLLAMTNKGAEFDRLLNSLQDRLDYCEQPFILAALVAELVIDCCAARIEQVNVDLNTLEEESGLHRYRNRPKGHPLQMNFMEALEVLHFSDRTLGLDTMRLKFVLPTLTQMATETKRIGAPRKGRGRDEHRVLVLDGCRMMEESIQRLRQYTRNQLLRARFQDNRVHTQLTVVSRLMAQSLATDTSILARASQQDSAVMRAIAVDTKKDSSSMKTIAVLGMLFWPSTLIASLFAAPIFHWSEQGLPVANAGFKYYWATSAPLTLLVISVWAAATLLPWERWFVRWQSRTTVVEAETGGHVSEECYR